MSDWSPEPHELFNDNRPGDDDMDDEGLREQVRAYLEGGSDTTDWTDYQIRRYIETGDPETLSLEQQHDRLVYLNFDIDRDKIPYNMTPEARRELSKAIGMVHDNIRVGPEYGRGGSRESIYFNYGVGLNARCKAEFGQEDGTVHTYYIDAYYGRVPKSNKKELVVSYEMYTHNNDRFWKPRADAYSYSLPIVVCDGTYYTVGEEPRDPNRDKSFRGFGGRRWYFQLIYPQTVEQYTEEMTCEIFTTTNLWHGGTIPPYWREHGLYSNARQLTKEQFDEYKEANQKVLNPNDFARNRVSADMMTPEQHRIITS